MNESSVCVASGVCMRIVVVTGEKGSGKSTYLKDKIDASFSGVITRCINREKRQYYFDLVNEGRSLLCCHYEESGMMFHQENFDLVNAFLLELNQKKEIKNFVIDEIGWVELEERGFYHTLSQVLKHPNIENLYLSVRYDMYKELLKKFEITSFELVELTT